MKDNVWLTEEQKSITDEIKYSKKKKLVNYDNMVFLIVLLLSIPILCTQIYAENFPPIRYEGSAQWRCKKCGNNIYTEHRDWKGDYHCPRCGTRKGDD